MMQKHMLPGHCLDITTSRHISLQSELRLWTIPDFRMSAKIANMFWLILYLSSISVIEIGSYKIYIVMLNSIRREAFYL